MVREVNRKILGLILSDCLQNGRITPYVRKYNCNSRISLGIEPRGFVILCKMEEPRARSFTDGPEFIVTIFEAPDTVFTVTRFSVVG